MDRFRDSLIVGSLSTNNWDIRAVVKETGIPKATLYRHIKRLGLTRPVRAQAVAR